MIKQSNRIRSKEESAHDVEHEMKFLMIDHRYEAYNEFSYQVFKN